MTLSTYNAIVQSGIFGIDGQIRLIIIERESSTHAKSVARFGKLVTPECKTLDSLGSADLAG
jgi:hypothetical protein